MTGADLITDLARNYPFDYVGISCSNGAVFRGRVKDERSFMFIQLFEWQSLIIVNRAGEIVYERDGFAASVLLADQNTIDTVDKGNCENENL